MFPGLAGDSRVPRNREPRLQYMGGLHSAPPKNSVEDKRRRKWNFGFGIMEKPTETKTDRVIETELMKGFIGMEFRSLFTQNRSWWYVIR